MSWTEYPHAYRHRRSALLPSGILLTPEDEALVISRTGRRPIPPPDLLRLSWPSEESAVEENKFESNKPQGPEIATREGNEVRTRIDSCRNHGKVEEPIAKGQQSDLRAESTCNAETTDPSPHNTIPVKSVMTAINFSGNRNRSSSSEVDMTRAEENQLPSPPPTAASPLSLVGLRIKS